MTSSEKGSQERSASAIVISESTFERLSIVQQLSDAYDEFVLVRSSDDMDELTASCRHFERCFLIVEGSALLKATPVQVSELLRRADFLRVLARVDNDHVVALRELLRFGCFGFVRDDTTLPCLRKILCAVARGEMWVPRRLLSELFQTFLFEQNSNRLSRRECEILILLGQELSNKCIAARLFISQETLRWHLRNIYAKTRARGRDQLIKYASEFNHVIPKPPSKATVPADDQQIQDAALRDTRVVFLS